MADDQPVPAEQDSPAPPPNVPAIADGLNISLRPEHMTVLLPPNEPHILLTQEQIDKLRKHGDDQSFNWFLALAALAAGFAQNLFSVIDAIGNSTALEAWNAIAACLCVACGAGAVAKYTEHRKNKASMDLYVAKLKSGTAVNVR